jgi:hypothetical protein
LPRDEELTSAPASVLIGDRAALSSLHHCQIAAKAANRINGSASHAIITTPRPDFSVEKCGWGPDYLTIGKIY